MLYLLIKAGLPSVIVALVSETAHRSPGRGALLASLPLISILGIVWSSNDTADGAHLAAHSHATFWYVRPSLPMLLLIPALLGRSMSLAAALVAGCLLAVALYVMTSKIAPALGADV